MTITVALDHLNEVVEKALRTLGLKNPERDIVQRVLMYAQMCGSSQGLIKIKERTVLPDKDCTAITIENKSSAIARINGGGNTGMYVMHQATMTAASLVKESGIALVSAHNTRSSTGAIGFYASLLAESGYVAMVLAGSPKVMAIEGGIDPVFGTNPIAIAIPTNDNPVVLDMATAATTWFAVINARDNNQSLPDNIAFDKNGNVTINPVDAMQGALKAFGGAKGSGLALMFEFLTSTLGNASMTGDQQDNRGNTIIAIDPEVIDQGFRSRATELVKRLKQGRIDTNSMASNNANTNTANRIIRLPGEASAARANQCLTTNKITLDGELYQHLLTLT